MNRRRTVILLAPVAPPCFPTRNQWVEFLGAAADDQTGSRAGPLDLRHGTPAFNFSFDFCSACTAKYAIAMQSLNQCKPGHLRALAPSTEKQP